MNPLSVLASENYYEVPEEKNIVSYNDWISTEVGEFPINSESSEWNELSYTEALMVCDMPNELATSLSTEELVEYAVNYPLLTDILAFNTVEDGLEHLQNSSTIFKELFSRSNCTEELLMQYANLSCDYTALEKTHDMLGTGYLEKIFIEQYFGKNYENLSLDDSKKFIDEFSDKYEEKTDSVQEYSTSTIFYQGISETMDTIPEVAIPENIKTDIIDNYDLSGPSFTKTNLNIGINPTNGAKVYYGYQYVNNTKTYCYKYYSGEYSSTEKKNIESAFESQHPSFVKKRTCSKKYNCHSYAWYSTSKSNQLWMYSDPTSIANDTNYYKKWRAPMRNPKSGDKIIFYDSNGFALHSAILTSSTKCKSKLGSLGVYKTTISDMMSLYPASSSQTYLPK